MAVTAVIMAARLPGHGLVQGRLPWGVLLVVFVGLSVSLAITEMLADNFVEKSGSHAFSLREFPFALGLLVLPPFVSTAAVLFGLGIAFSFQRRIPMARVFFNVAGGVLSATAGMALAFRLASVLYRPGFRAWTVALVAVAVSTVIGSVFTHLSRKISGSRLSVGNFVDTTLSSTSFAVASTSLAVLVVWAARSDFSVLFLILPLVAMTFSSFRNAIQDRAKRGEIEFLYSALQLMHDQRGTEFGLAGVWFGRSCTFLANCAWSRRNHPLRAHPRRLVSPPGRPARVCAAERRANHANAIDAQRTW